MELKMLAGFEASLQAEGLRPQTVEIYSEATRRVLTDLKVDAFVDVTPIDLAGWRRRRVEQVAPATVNIEVAALRRFFRWAVDYGLITVDPSTHLRAVQQTARLAPRWLDRNAQHGLIRAVQQAVQSADTDDRRRRAVRDSAMVALMLHAGLRESEVCGLDVSDIQVSDRKGIVTVRSGKREKRREVPLNRDARATMTMWLEVRGGAPGPLFIGPDGRLTGRTIQNVVKALAKRAGIEASPHTLRHTFCHELVERGKVPIDQVALLAGHTTASGLPRIETTLRYTMPGSEELEKAVESIEW